EFGRDCGDISCDPGQKCILSRIPCEKDTVEGCGSYPECKTDQLANDFTIDNTLTIANTRSSIIIPSTSTSTTSNRDNDFELLTDFGHPSDPLATHAGQRQTNVLVIVQDGSQQPQPPNPWQNRPNAPCQVSPLYPYSCQYPSYGVNPSVGLPSYPQARSANVPRLVPQTPPCYYNCYPKIGASPYSQYGSNPYSQYGSNPYSQYGYPLARSANPNTLNNNYLMYLTLNG
ncbi:hypothetical protein KR009_011938, partial [Drosophila setifemur]